MMAPSEVQCADAGRSRIGIDCVADRSDVDIDSVNTECNAAMSGPVHLLVEDGLFAVALTSALLSCVRHGTAWESTVSGMEYTAE